MADYSHVSIASRHRKGIFCRPNAERRHGSALPTARSVPFPSIIKLRHPLFCPHPTLRRGAALVVVAVAILLGVRVPTLGAQESRVERYRAALDSAYAARQRGDLTRAREFFVRAVAADTSQALPRIELAYIALSAGDKATAVDFLQQAVERDRTRADLRRQLGFALVDLKRIREAVVAFEGIGAIPPGLSDRDHLALGYLYDNLSETRNAIRNYKATDVSLLFATRSAITRAPRRAATRRWPCRRADR